MESVTNKPSITTIDQSQYLYMDEIRNERSNTSEPNTVFFNRLLKRDNTDNPPQSSGPEVDDLNERGVNRVLLPDVSDRRPLFPKFPTNQPSTVPDVNIYQHKKTLAQGMMDLALLSANANQLRYVLQTDGRHPYYYPSLTMIAVSLFVQIAVGIGLIWNSRYDVKIDAQMCKADKANNWTVIGIFLVTILNVFISSFGVVDQDSTSVR